jgi:hypothetical protein
MLKKETLRDKLEKMMMAVTFAEAGEHETALRMMGKRPDRRRQKRIRSKEEKRPDRRPVLMA